MKPFPNHNNYYFFFSTLLILLPQSTLSQTSKLCPLDFSVAEPYISSSPPSDRCRFSLQILHLVESHYLLASNLFLPSPSAAASCWSRLSSLLSLPLPSSCGFSAPSISLPCLYLTSRSAFASSLPPQSLADLNSSCDRPLSSPSSCTSCTTAISRLKSSYLPGPDISDVTDCADHLFIYAAAAANRFGPSDSSTVYCLFLLQIVSRSSSSGVAVPVGIAASVVSLIAVGSLAVWCLIGRRRRRRRRTLARNHPLVGSSASLMRFGFEEIRAATGNFSRENIIGRGGYGNVYRGVLKDGGVVAVKRFKNCSAAGDASFVHEVEVIASVRHVNLVGLRGYCTETTSMEGYQRIIVCDLIANGSLHDHLFGFGGRKLSWPDRRRIVLGTARGLAYLHSGARPAIIHRDIKASNILIDEGFEAKVADFGLAKFAPEGTSHLSTRVAGTLGYVAPEYALFGQVSEKSDVFSYGVVMLELLSGKKAFKGGENGQNWLVTDWAWSLVREGKTLDVIEEGMEELETNEVLERYVLVAVLCSHPQLHARPTMDQAVKILESDLSVPPIPDRPVSIIANKEDLERSMVYPAEGGDSSSRL